MISYIGDIFLRRICYSCPGLNMIFLRVILSVVVLSVHVSAGGGITQKTYKLSHMNSDSGAGIRPGKHVTKTSIECSNSTLCQGFVVNEDGTAKMFEDHQIICPILID